MANPIGGQASGEFKETSGRLQPFYVVTRNTMGILTPDAFTQLTPSSSVAAPANLSATLVGLQQFGVLGGSVAFTRGDVGNNFVGGPTAAAAVAGVRPLGFFMNDANGNRWENAPAVASGRGTYVHGSGSTVGLSVYETKNLATNADLVWAVGDLVYASRNGLATNVSASTNTYESASPTVLGVVKCAPDATSALLVIDLRV